MGCERIRISACMHVFFPAQKSLFLNPHVLKYLMALHPAPRGALAGIGAGGIRAKLRLRF